MTPIAKDNPCPTWEGETPDPARVQSPTLLISSHDWPHLDPAPMPFSDSLAPRSGERVRVRGSFHPTGAVSRCAPHQAPSLSLSRNDSDGFGSATVPVALVGVSPTSPRMNSPSPIGEDSSGAKVFGETPKTAVETTALPKATESFRLSLFLNVNWNNKGRRPQIGSRPRA